MLKFWSVSGKEMASMPVDEMKSLSTVKSQLVPHCGHSRFQQALVHDGRVLDNTARFDSPVDVQVVILPYATTSQNDADQLARVAEIGQTTRVEEWLSRPQNPNLFNRYGASPLGLACATDRLEVARLLLEAFADSNAYFDVGIYRRPPLGASLSLGSRPVTKNIVAALLQSRANPDLPDLCVGGEQIRKFTPGSCAAFG
ncbi:Ankrd39 [Symbiodinium sp. CCMP2456]|nr:Ankrd39 [Symbiodinium sp. CCMP2456]